MQDYVHQFREQRKRRHILHLQSRDYNRQGSHQQTRTTPRELDELRHEIRIPKHLGKLSGDLCKHMQDNDGKDKAHGQKQDDQGVNTQTGSFIGKDFHHIGT